MRVPEVKMADRSKIYRIFITKKSPWEVKKEKANRRKKLQKFTVIHYENHIENKEKTKLTIKIRK